MARITSLCAVSAVALLSSCARPATFVDTRNHNAVEIALQQEMGVDDAWTKLVAFFKERFELETVYRGKNGFIRTAWVYDWHGPNDGKYRVRATVYFNSQSRIVRLVSEAQSDKVVGWSPGTDGVFEAMLQRELMSMLGGKA